MEEMYSNSFKSVHPKQAHQTLTNRIRIAKNANEELLEYFRERIGIEDQYNKALNKLAKRTSSSSSSPANGGETGRFRFDQSNPEEDGHQLARRILEEELLQTIASHSNYQSLLQNEIESGIRNVFNDESKLKNAEEQLTRLMKSYDESEQKLTRSTQKLNSASSNLRKIQTLQTKQAEDQQSFNQAKQIWSQQSPQAFNTYQSIDYQRLVDLFETLTKFETIQADHHRQLIEISEQSTLALLAFDFKEDIQRFALTNGTIPDPTTNSNATPDNQLDPVTPAPAHSRNPTTDRPSEAESLQAIDETIDPEEQLRSSVRSPSRRPLQSSAASPSPSVTRQPNGSYDPNHPEIPKLNAPNISIPIRSTPNSPANLSQHTLPPRTLYVQSHPSSESVSNNRTRQSADLNRSQRSNMRMALSPKRPSPTTTSTTTPAATTKSEKLFSRSRFVNILSRNNTSNNNTSSGLKSIRRLSQTNLSSSHINDSGPASAKRHQSPLPSADRSRQQRSSSMMAHDSSGRINSDQQPPPLPSPSTTENNNKTWSSTRLAQLLPGTGPLLLKKKFSQSGRHWKPSSSSNIKDQSSAPASINLDADGFTIPPQDRDRPPWELDAHAEVLSLDRTESSINNHQNSGTNIQEETDQLVERSSTNETPRHNFAIKPTTSSSEVIREKDDESERKAAIERVQNTLSSTSVNGVGLMGGTRRSNTALRGRRADGRGVTMYDPPSLPDPGSTSLLRRGTLNDKLSSNEVFQPSSKTIEPRNLEPSSRSLSDNSSPTKLSPSTNNFSNLYHSPEPLSSTTFSDLPISMTTTHPQQQSEKPDEEEGHGLSRSNSFTSNISNSNLARYGFMNILPPLPPPPHPTTTTSTSKNPFINMFSPSNSISTHDINHQPEELTESITESHDLSFPTNKPSSSTTPKINHPHLFKVVEKVNVLMDHGSVTKLLIIGQVFITRKIVVQLITNLSGSGSDTEDKKSLSFDIRGLDRLEKLVYPDELVSPIQTDKDINKDPTDKIGRYNIDLNRLLSVFTSSSQEEGEEEGEQVCILKYRVFIDPKLTSIQDYHNLASQFVPLIVVPKWRFSHHKTELVINYHLSENFKLFHSNTSSSSEEELEVCKEENGRTSYKDIILNQFNIKTSIFNNNNDQNSSPRLDNDQIDSGSSKKMKKNVIDHQSLPIGKFDPQDNSIQWDIPSPSSSNTEDTDERKSSGSGGIKLDGLKGKLICRFIHPSSSSDPSSSSGKPTEIDQDQDLLARAWCGPVHVHWTVNGISFAGLDFTFSLHESSYTVDFNVVCSTFLCR
ncbi:hypothetical protein Pst134EA_017651 [Puccinia striiformis f. sp. tritici]|uniref:hypothetical protein n=1 Tax=Puccinia striiformis f. sp. tritici TaxID=168172 RepID=UPI0020074A64|nr:hypothetical protein Pst134EA_017651 [Puccinia striiformis f. sp. tritici]KAH9461342.1 hypothetical protein Pst134EA_017651 [Puccinia striiformis f. sp. tritici]